MCPPLTEHEKRKSKIQNRPHSNTIVKIFLYKEHEKWDKKKKSKKYNRKAITFTVHYNNIKLKYTAWFNMHLEK